MEKLLAEMWAEKHYLMAMGYDVPKWLTENLLHCSMLVGLGY